MRVAALAALLGAVHVVAVDPTTVCSGKPNTLPIYDGQGVLQSNNTFGKVYHWGPPSLTPKIRVVHAYGTPYEMGYAQGSLLRDGTARAHAAEGGSCLTVAAGLARRAAPLARPRRPVGPSHWLVPAPAARAALADINELIPQMFDYIYSEIAPYVKFLPPAVRTALEKVGVNAALEVTYMLTKPFIPQHFIDEAQGIADGSGVSYDQVMHVALFPELIKAACSIIGAWGPAVADDSGKLLQLRALDWTTDGPFQQFPTVMVYHPAEGYGHAYSVVGWAGMLGAISGYSSANMAISEKVWLSYKGRASRAGYPFSFLLRDILQFDEDTDEALSRIASAERTCSIFIGVGDDNNDFKAVQYSHEEVHILNDRNFPQFANHTRHEGLVYVDKHVQWSKHQCMPALMNSLYGNLSPETIIRYVTALEQTGDMQVVVYDYLHHHMYVSNAAPVDAQGNCAKAYDRPFVRFHMDDLFGEAL